MLKCIVAVWFKSEKVQQTAVDINQYKKSEEKAEHFFKLDDKYFC